MNSKATQDRHQRMLMDLAKQPGNDVCADCRGRAPRWASWNLGIFLCVQCAGVHRKMGTHISKVKSLTLDTWTREQVDKMKELGNTKSNKIFNPDEVRNRPPTNIQETERDSELEKFIRAKYEYRRFIDSKPPPVPTKDATFLRLPSSSSSSSLGHGTPPGRNGLGGSSYSSNNSSSSSIHTYSTNVNASAYRRRATGQDASLNMPTSDRLSSANSISRSRTAPIPASWAEAQARARSTEPVPPVPHGGTQMARAAPQSSLSTPASVPPRASSAVPAARTVSLQQTPTATVHSPASQQNPAAASSSVFDDLVSLSGPSSSTPQPPPQMNPWAQLQAQPAHVFASPGVQEPSNSFWGASASLPFNGAQQASQLGASAFGGTYPQHANTLPNFSLTSPDGSLQQSHQMSMIGNPVAMGVSGLSPQYAQHRSASLGSMAFSPGGAMTPTGNPFLSMQQTGAAFGPAASPSQQQQQLCGTATSAPTSSPFGSFATNMMPSSQANGLYTQQNQQQQQQQGPQQVQYGHAMSGFGVGGYAVQAGQQAFQSGAGGGTWS